MSADPAWMMLRVPDERFAEIAHRFEAAERASIPTSAEGLAISA